MSIGQRIRRENVRMVGKLAVVAAGMFAFGYALVPLYRAICEMTGINILALSELEVPGGASGGKNVRLRRFQSRKSITSSIASGQTKTSRAAPSMLFLAGERISQSSGIATASSPAARRTGRPDQ